MKANLSAFNPHLSPALKQPFCIFLSEMVQLLFRQTMVWK